MEEFSFQLNYDEQSYTARQYHGEAEEVVIPEMFLGKPVTILFDKLFTGHTEIRSVSIPDTVTDLGLTAVSDFENKSFLPAFGTCGDILFADQVLKRSFFRIL